MQQVNDIFFACHVITKPTLVRGSCCHDSVINLLLLLPRATLVFFSFTSGQNILEVAQPTDMLHDTRHSSEGSALSFHA